METALGKETVRRDAWLKVEGKAKYNDDYYSPACLQARLLTSVYAHAEIVNIDITEALNVPGVRAVVTGIYCNMLSGSILQDMPVLATGRVRYFGEPVAIVIADEEYEAASALKKITVEYKPLPVVNSIEDSLKNDPALIHPDLVQYKRTVAGVYPEEHTNISNRTRIRKGNMDEGWSKSAVIIEAEYRIPQANHAFIETRNARAQIEPGGRIIIHSATQAPHASRALIAKYLNVSEANVVVITPFVGGAFGGKVNPHIELMAYFASRAVGGKEVRIALTREESFYSSACKIGAKMNVRLGADASGKLQALKAEYYIDSGAYADTSPIMSRAAAANCSGAYNIPSIQCDSISVYTNHVYATSFRGFGHEVSTFAIERTIEKLAQRLGMDAAKIRMINALKEGDYTPTQAKLTVSNLGSLEACITRLKDISSWDSGTMAEIDTNIVRAKGMACFSKTSSSPTDAVSTAIVTFCSDGSVLLNCSAVECGPGMTTALPQILAECLKISPDKISMNLSVDTQDNPVHWKTVASMTTYMAGNAIIEAAADVIRQLKENAAFALRCNPENVVIENEKAYLKEDPSKFLELKDIVFCIKESDGNAVGKPVIGRGRFVMERLSDLNTETGEGKPGPYWTVGAQAVEIEYNKREHTFRLINAATVIDAGKVINPECAAGQVTGGMNTGLSLATREINHYDAKGEIKDTSFRTYKIMHFNENPRYIAEFIETPNISGPFGLRGLGEHAVLGMPPALANALCRAAGIQLDTLPITFESVWNMAENQRGNNAGV